MGKFLNIVHIHMCDGSNDATRFHHAAEASAAAAEGDEFATMLSDFWQKRHNAPPVTPQ